MRRYYMQLYYNIKIAADPYQIIVGTGFSELK